MNIIEKVRACLRGADVYQAIQILEDYLRINKIPDKIFIILGSKYNTLNSDKITGTISNDEFSIRLSQIQKSILDWIELYEDELLKYEYSNEIDEYASVNFSDLKERVKQDLDNGTIKSAIQLLLNLIVDNNIFVQLSKLEIEYEDVVWRFNSGKFDLSLWEKEVSNISNRIYSVLNQIIVDQLIPNWKAEYVNLSLGVEEYQYTPQFVLFSGADKILIPDNITEKNDRERFKRLMYLYQDSIQAGKYKDAYRFCLKIRADIEPESAQLYEYLLLSFFKLHQQEKLIANAIIGDGTELSLLFVYSSRFIDLQNRIYDEKAKVKIPKSVTGYHNIEQIASGLILAISKEYANVKYDHILSDKEPNPILKAKVLRCIELAMDVSRFIKPNLSFAEITVSELCGVNKFQWIGVNSKGSLVNISKFDALTYLRNAFKLIDINAKSKKEKFERRNLIKSKLLVLIRRRVNKIYRMIDQDDSSPVQKIIKLITSHRVAIHFFPKEPSLISYIIDELSENKSNIIWYVLNDYGDLTTAEDIDLHSNFNPRQTLYDTFNLIGDDTEWQRHLYQLTLRVSKRKEERIDKKYTSLNNAIQIFIENDSENYRISSRFGPHQTIIECIVEWYSCYLATNSEITLNKILHELSGDGYFFHFNIVGHQNLEFIINQIESRINIMELLKGSKQFTYESYLDKICRNYFKKMLKSRLYQSAKFYSYRGEHFNNIINCLRSITNYYINVWPNASIIDLLWEEIFDEKNIKYLDISEKSLVWIDHKSKLAVKYLDDLLDYLRSVGISYDKMYTKILRNRLNEILYTYNGSVSDVRMTRI